MKRLLLVLSTLLWLVSPASAANLVSIADGNLTTAATWGTVDTAATLVSTSTNTAALTTGNLDSSTFVLGASQVKGFVLRLASRAAGSPSNTMTVILRDSTTATNTCSVTANVSDLPVADTTNDQGGWAYFKCSAAFTPNGTDSYLIRATLSATSTAVSLSTDATTNNWQRLIVRTTTATPTTGDDMYVLGVFDGVTNPATTGTRTVTMNSTAATDYGSNLITGSRAGSGLNISNRGTVTWGTSASTTYILQLSGFLLVNSGGTYNQGTSGTPIPTGSTATLQFDGVADDQFGMFCWGTCNFYGSPRTAGKLFTWTLLTANASASATSLTVQDDTGWLSGDGIVIATTTVTRGQTEVNTLTGNATASTLAVSAITNAHGGDATSKIQAEVILTTRNVKVTNVGAFVYVVGVQPTGVFTALWTNFNRVGNGSTSFGIATTTGSALVQYCHFDAGKTRSIIITGSGNYTIDNTTSFNANTNGGIPALSNTSASTTAWALTNNVFISNNENQRDGFDLNSLTGGTISGDRFVGFAGNGDGIDLFGNVGSYGSLTNIVAHSNALDGIALDTSGTTPNGPITISCFCWRNLTAGVQVPAGNDVNAARTIVNSRLFGNHVTGIFANGSGVANLVIDNSILAGDSGSAQPAGVQGSNGGGVMFILGKVYNSTFGVASGSYVAHSAGDFWASSSVPNLYIFNAYGSTFASTVPFDPSGGCGALCRPAIGSHLSSEKDGGVNGAHKDYWPNGTRTFNITTVHTTYSEQLAPSRATSIYKFTSGPHYTAITNGSTATVCAWIQKDGSYAGNAPRLMVQRNDAIGITADTVLGTFSASSGTWQQVCGTTAAATDDGVFTFFVDVDGSAGNVFVADWTVS